ncbi:PQQ-like domain-containing protein [Pseudarcicella hirudinis]|uniref:PQQ-like domain-containing protein n=1 Tax=Pseudarcicella hirudinis TaxID=1079859 RepID=A0A1I5VVB8_9BACT|nr:PQQ-binding-like beta-propeller repeat protein [Pseudarcicella hirudinis]SFQ11524.1 PQQ-like domain-containing protein [Pseudarcicella hirudinis]
MNTLGKVFQFFVALLLLSSTSAFSQVKLTKLWESDTTLTTPESIYYEPKENILYISCINGGPSADNSKSFISKIDLNGKITKLKLTENLQSTKGLVALGSKLYVTEIFKLVEIDLKTGKVLNKYEVPEAKFLNDVTVDAKNNVVYFTDMRSDRLWKLDKGQIVKVAEGAPLKSPNGVVFEKGKLIVGNGDGKVLAYDLKTGEYSTKAEGLGGIDGILPDGKGGYLASEWRGKVWHVNPEGKTSLLLDLVDAKINTADFEYIPGKKLLVIPNFFKNKVTAYSVD